MDDLIEMQAIAAADYEADDEFCAMFQYLFTGRLTADEKQTE